MPPNPLSHLSRRGLECNERSAAQTHKMNDKRFTKSEQEKNESKKEITMQMNFSQS